jgi:hypothetical protein
VGRVQSTRSCDRSDALPAARGANPETVRLGDSRVSTASGFFEWRVAVVCSGFSLKTEVDWPKSTYEFRDRLDSTTALSCARLCILMGVQVSTTSKLAAGLASAGGGAAAASAVAVAAAAARATRGLSSAAASVVDQMIAYARKEVRPMPQAPQSSGPPLVGSSAACTAAASVRHAKAWTTAQPPCPSAPPMAVRPAHAGPSRLPSTSPGWASGG